MPQLSRGAWYLRTTTALKCITLGRLRAGLCPASIRCGSIGRDWDNRRDRESAVGRYSGSCFLRLHVSVARIAAEPSWTGAILPYIERQDLWQTGLLGWVPVQRCTVHKHRNWFAHAPERLHEESTWAVLLGPVLN
jgi:hypothetical protein